jgi:hypothetical protein
MGNRLLRHWSVTKAVNACSAPTRHRQACGLYILWRKPGPAGAWPAITLKGDIEQHRAHQVLLIGQLHVVLKDVEHLPGEPCFGLCRCFVWVCWLAAVQPAR